MRRSGAAVRLTILALAATAFAAGCGGGGGANGTVPGTPASNSPGGAGPNAAVVTFHAVIPPKGQTKSYRGLKPDYIAPTATTLTIKITNSGNSHIVTLTSQKQCGASGCFFNATTSLPVLATPYLFTVTAIGTSGSPLSSAFVTQTLVPGPNSVALTLQPIVDHAAVSVTGSLGSGGNVQTLPITATTFDADGNAIPNGLTFASEFPIAITEVDPLNAFSLVTTSPGSADCNIATPATCSLRSNADSISISFNPSASAFPAEPSYYPQEAIVSGAGNSGSTVTAGNSTAVASPKCLPQPLCVYAEPLYPLVLATGSINSALGLEINPLLSISVGSTIYTDAGTITSAGTTAYAFNAPSGGTNLSSQSPSGLVAAAGNVYTVDYSGGTAPDNNQYIDTISPTAIYATTEYTPDPNNLFSGLGNGDDIILGPDGNLWWIDPLTGDLRFANPATPGTAGVCQLNPNSNSLFLTAYQIVSTPAGVSPSRIWFSAFDAVNFANSYIGYVNVAAGSNSCGAGQTGHFKVIDTSGNLSTPDGMAVDNTGTLWFNSGDETTQNFTSIGQGTINGAGVISLTTPVKLPGAMGAATSAWDILYNPQDGYLYTAVDGGFIGRFLPSAGVASATAYTLPLPLAANMFDLTGNGEADGSSCPTSVFPECFPQFSWDPGAGGTHGRLTFVTAAGLSGTSVADNVVQLNLDYAGVTFSTAAKSSLPARFHGRRPPRRPHLARFRRF